MRAQIVHDRIYVVTKTGSPLSGLLVSFERGGNSVLVFSSPESGHAWIDRHLQLERVRLVPVELDNLAEVAIALRNGLVLDGEPYPRPEVIKHGSTWMLVAVRHD